jgi:hypothetical protein
MTLALLHSPMAQQGIKLIPSHSQTVSLQPTEGPHRDYWGSNIGIGTKNNAKQGENAKIE